MLLDAVRSIVRPPPMIKPSVWAEQNVHLPAEVTKRPGRYNPRIKPWGEAVVNLRHDNPDKRGAITIKPSQIGFTTGKLMQLASSVVCQPGPVLYLISNKEQAGFYGSDVFMRVVEKSPALADRFYRDDDKSDQQRELVTQKPYKGGRVDFVGAGSVASVSSRTYPTVFLDEFEIFQDNWPKDKAGDGFTFAQGRARAVASSSWIETWSHPRRAREGIHKLYCELSDMREWGFACPHEACGKDVLPRWSMVRFGFAGIDEASGDATDEGTIDPATARLHCPHCDRVITDAQRAVAVWPAGSRPGATGRMIGTLSAEKAAQREFVGLWIHALADPDVSVVGLARGWAACTDAATRMAYLNVMIGEPFAESGAAITADLVSKIVQRMDRVELPGGRLGCQYVTVGVDVQAPEANPTLYVRTSAWSVTGMEWVVDMVKLRGWAALHEYLRTLRVVVRDPDQSEGLLVPHVCAIDCGYLTGHVLDFCRTDIRHALGHHKVKMLPMRFAPHVKSTLPAVMPSEAKRTDPRRPHLGPIDLWELHRHTWVDRQMNRMATQRVTIVGPVPDDFLPHASANVLMPVEDEHGWASTRMEWGKIKDRRDDWVMAGVYAEAAAALDPDLRLDRLYEMASVPDEGGGREGAGRGDDAGSAELGGGFGLEGGW